MTAPLITALVADDAVIKALSALLIEAVADGAGMSFMHPLADSVAGSFWADSLARAARADRQQRKPRQTQ